MVDGELGETGPLRATIRVDATSVLGHVDPMIYGHFLESNFFGNIEGGVFDEGSPRSLPGPGAAEGLRADVVEACRALHPPIVRWPGGNFASAYHFEDGIGPRDARPRRPEVAWGGEESNRFGTDEFLAWCRLVGTEPYLVNSCRSLEEALHWLEYTNGKGATHHAELRRRNGHEAPYPVRVWGIGNEVYGRWQVGHRPPEEYARAAHEHARFMRVIDPELTLVGVGHPSEAWMRPLIAEAGEQLDYVSLHLYGGSRHLYSGRAGEDDYDAIVAQALYFERQLAAFSELVAHLAEEHGVERPISIALDEWNLRHYEPASWPEPLAGEDGGVAPRELPEERELPEGEVSGDRLRVNRWSPRTLADALFSAGVFHGLHRLSGRAVAPRMANTVNLVNANALVAVRPGGLTRATTYFVWQLYQDHLGTVALPVAVEGPSRLGAVRQGAGELEAGAGRAEVERSTIPYLDVVATRRDGVAGVQVAAINRHRHAPIDARVVLGTDLVGRARRFSLGGAVEDVFAVNSLDRPDQVGITAEGVVELADGICRLPPHSVTVLEIGGA